MVLAQAVPQSIPGRWLGEGQLPLAKSAFRLELIIWLTVTFQCPAVTSGTL